MLFKRNFACEIYDGQLDGNLSEDTRIADYSDKPKQKAVIGVTETSGGGQIVASGSFTVPLPDGYTNASYLHTTFIVEGLVRVKTTSPDHAASTTLLQGSATSPGIHQIVEHTSTLVIENTSAADAVKVSYCCIMLPDISDEDNFRGIQLDGSQTAIT